jgi:DNA repair exonuclease SbcCD ATPase subunit
LCIGLFGEPNPNRIMNSGKKMSGHFIHNQRPPGTASHAMHVSIIMEVDGGLYEIVRKYAVQDKTESKILNAELYVVEAGYTDRTLQCSGSTLVNAWVSKNCGSIESLMKTSIVTQLDNNNFFFAKSDEQKKIIDHAVNLGALQSFGNIVHEAHLGYNSVIKTLSTIINASQATEQLEAIATEEEIEEYTDEVAILRERIAEMETKKDVLAAQCGDVTRAPAYTKERALSLIDESKGVQGNGIGHENASERRVLLQHLIEELGACDEVEDADEASVAQIKVHLDGVNKEKPHATRTRAVIENDMAELSEWFEENAEWIDEPDAAYEALEQAKSDVVAGEKLFQEWAESKCVEPLCKWDKTSARSSNWKKTVRAYRDLEGVLANERDALVQHQLARVQPTRLQKHEATWNEEWEAYKAALAARQENEWKTAHDCKENATQTRAYIKKREDVSGELVSLQSLLERCKNELDSHEDWKAEQTQWLKLVTKFEKFTSTKEVDATIDAMRNLLEHRRNLEQALQVAQRSLAAPDDEWKQELATWHSTLAKAKKHNWTSVESVESDIAHVEDKYIRAHVLAKELVGLEKECAELEAHKYNPDCAACRSNPLHVRHKTHRVRIESIQAELEECGSIELLEKQKAYLRKGLECARFLEGNRASMERKLKDKEAKVKDLMGIVESTTAELAQVLDATHIQKKLEKAIATRDALVNYLSNNKTMTTKFARLESLCAECEVLEASIARGGKTLARMQDESVLEETLAHWDEAVAVCTFIEQNAARLEAEGEAWDIARTQWAASAEWERARAELEARVSETERRVLEAHALAYASWYHAEAGIKEQRNGARERCHAIEKFLASLGEKQALQCALDAEKNACDTYVKWETLVKSVEAKYNAARLCLYRKELGAIEATEKAVHTLAQANMAIAWYEFQSLKETLSSLQARVFGLSQIIEQYGRESSRHVAQSRTHAVLNQLWMKWTTNRDLLAKLDERLVGERGSRGAGTYKEWVYANHVIPMIEKQVNKFLRDIDDIQVRIEYSAKSLQYFVSDRGNETSFAASSGYQQFIIGLAMRQALSVVGGAGNNLRHLFIDEGFGACDSTNIEKAHDILKLLIDMGKYKSILLVTHLETLKDVIPMKINIVRKGPFSKLEYGEQYPIFKTSSRKPGRPKKDA